MVRYEDECVGCATENYPCRGASCPLRRVPEYYCDNCDPRCTEPLDEVYEVEGQLLCEDCLKEMFLWKGEQ